MGRLGDNRGKNRTRASAIIQDMQIKPDEDLNNPPVDVVDVVEEVIDTPPVVDTPPVDVVPAVEDTPPVDIPPVEDSAPPVDEIPPVEAPVDLLIEPTVVSDEIILSKLSETLGREIKSYDDLKPAEVAVDPEVAQLLKWKEDTGLSLTQFAEYTKDYSNMGDLDVAKEILAKKYPTFTQEELNYKLKGYIFDAEIDEDHLKIEKSIALKTLAADGREQLEQNKLSLKPAETSSSLTKEQNDLISYANQAKQTEKTTQESQLDYSNKLNSAALSLTGLNLNLDEGVVIEHKVPDNEKKELSKYVAEMPHWYNEDGSANHENIALDGYKIKNFDTLLKAAFEQGKAVGTEGTIKDGGNINLDGTSKPQGGNEEAKGNIDDVVSKLVGNRAGSKFRFRKSNK